MDRELTQNRTSDVIPISLNKDLSVSRRGTQAAAIENFEQLSACAEEQIRSAAGEILEGKINVNPYRLGDRTGCDYCGYRNICGFDTRLNGYEYRRIRKMSLEEAIAAMKGVGKHGSSLDGRTAEGDRSPEPQYPGFCGGGIRKDRGAGRTYHHHADER